MSFPGDPARAPWLDDRQVDPLSDRLANKRIALCVTGGIAAIESPRVARALRRHGAQVRAFMTAAAQSLITPLALEWGTGAKVTTELGGAAEHIATDDLVLVAPATLDIVAKSALGLASDPVSTLIASALGRLPLVFAPAMHLSLAQNPIYRRHLETLAPHAAFVPPRLAEGKAKVALPEDIARFVVRALARGPLAGAPVLVTAGATRAPIDRFRYVGNRSSGRLGVAIAEELWLRGAEVTLVYGPAEAEPPPGVRVVRVESPAEMREAVRAGVSEARAAVFAAAVLDFVPDAVADAKLPSDRPHPLTLVPTPKIIRTVDEVAPAGLVKVGFKLEYQPGGTSDEHLVAAAERALTEQRVEAVVVNAIDRLNGADRHPALLVTAQGERQALEGKPAIARALAELLERRLGGPEARARTSPGASVV